MRQTVSNLELVFVPALELQWICIWKPQLSPAFTPECVNGEHLLFPFFLNFINRRPLTIGPQLLVPIPRERLALVPRLSFRDHGWRRPAQLQRPLAQLCGLRRPLLLLEPVIQGEFDMRLQRNIRQRLLPCADHQVGVALRRLRCLPVVRGNHLENHAGFRGVHAFALRRCSVLL